MVIPGEKAVWMGLTANSLECQAASFRIAFERAEPGTSGHEQP